MPNLSIDFCGIKSPNPFWLASAPPTNTGDQVKRAFDEGWGGAVFKTLAASPITNVSSRFAAVNLGSQRIMGFNNIELISDRPLELNLRELSDIKKQFPKNVLIASLMFESKEQWQDIMRRVQDGGVDGVELNFGCPHGMCERGMGSAVGQEPALLSKITRWVREVSTIPIIVKLTPNVSDILEPAHAAVAGGAHAVSLINTIKSIMGVDLERMVPIPVVSDASTNGGYCGPAVKPIALHMIAQIARDPQIPIPISGMGGISTWQDAAEFMALGSTTLQVCTAVMKDGFRIIRELTQGLEGFLASKNMDSVSQLVGQAVSAYKDWGDLDMNHHVIARIDESKCIGCQLCYISCYDGSHQCIDIHDPKINASRIPWVKEDECVGCNLCALVCPVPDCISMVEQRHAPERKSWNNS